ncbi:Retrovirus-related Pol polyprotein from transposon RE1 [Linum grandiflorum]
MTSESHDSVVIRFNGSNYSIWAYAFKVFVQGKSLLGYLDGTKKEPAETATNSADIETWRTNNARFLSWLIGSVETPIALTFRSFDTAAQIWSHLQTVYNQVSSSRLSDLEYELANLTQGEQTINQYYMAATRLWTELDLLKASKLTATEEAAVLKERRKSRTLQFLMKLRPEFESVRAQLLSSDDLDIDKVLGELSRVEIRLCTQTSSIRLYLPWNLLLLRLYLPLNLPLLCVRLLLLLLYPPLILPLLCVRTSVRPTLNLHRIMVLLRVIQTLLDKLIMLKSSVVIAVSWVTLVVIVRNEIFATIARNRAILFRNVPLVLVALARLLQLRAHHSLSLLIQGALVPLRWIFRKQLSSGWFRQLSAELFLRLLMPLLLRLG